MLQKERNLQTDKLRIYLLLTYFSLQVFHFPTLQAQNKTFQLSQVGNSSNQIAQGMATLNQVDLFLAATFENGIVLGDQVFQNQGSTDGIIFHYNLETQTSNWAVQVGKCSTE